jgi:hypothetical protein
MVVTVLHKGNVLLLFWLLCAVHIVTSNIYSHEKVSYEVNKNCLSVGMILSPDGYKEVWNIAHII